MDDLILWLRALTGKKLWPIYTLILTMPLETLFIFTDFRIRSGNAKPWMDWYFNHYNYIFIMGICLCFVAAITTALLYWSTPIRRVLATVTLFTVFVACFYLSSGLFLALYISLFVWFAMVWKSEVGTIVKNTIK